MEKIVSMVFEILPKNTKNSGGGKNIQIYIIHDFKAYNEYDLSNIEPRT